MKKITTILLLSILTCLPLVSFGQFLIPNSGLITDCNDNSCPNIYILEDGVLTLQRCSNSSKIYEFPSSNEMFYGCDFHDVCIQTCHRIPLGQKIMGIGKYYITTSGFYNNGRKFSIKNVFTNFREEYRNNISILIGCIVGFIAYKKELCSNNNIRKRIGMSILIGIGVWVLCKLSFFIFTIYVPYRLDPTGIYT